MKLPTPEKQYLARTMRELHGVEITPDQAERQLTESLASIRRDLVAAGHPAFVDMPDAELRELVRQAMGWGGTSHPG